MNEVCPVCGGIGRFFDPKIFTIVWQDAFVCAACFGDGTAATAAARTLSGDYPPQREIIPDPVYPALSYP